MALKRFVGCILNGDTIADLPTHNTRWTDFKFVDLSNGDEWFNDGTAWKQFSGATKTETIKNKQIDPLYNNIYGMVLDPFYSNKREGWLIPSLTADGSLKGCLKGLPIPATTTYTLVRDTNEGYVSRLGVLNSGIDIGYISNSTTQFITRRRHNPRLKVRCSSIDPALLSTENIQLGFSTYLSASNGAWTVDANYAGAIMGFTTGFANFIARVSTGDGTNYNHYTSAIAKNELWNTYEIVMSDIDIKFYLNGTLFSTQTTNLPPLDTDLYLSIRLQKTAAVSKNFDIGKIFFSSNQT